MNTQERAKLHLFASVKKSVPSEYFDGGPQLTVLIDDPGPDFRGFAALMRELDAHFDVSDAVRMRIACHRGDYHRFDIDREPSGLAFIERLQAIGTKLIYEEDYVAGCKTTEFDSLAIGFEERLYEALEDPRAGETYDLYAYRVYDAVTVPYVPAHMFSFSDLKTNAKGDTYRMAYSRLVPIHVRNLMLKGAIAFECKPTGSVFHVRIASR